MKAIGAVLFQTNEQQRKVTSMIRGVHHTSISTGNIERMLSFYRDVLGLEEVIAYDWDVGNPTVDMIIGLKDTAVKFRMLKAGNTFIEIFEYLNPKGKAGLPERPACDHGLTHIAFDVVNIDELYKKLRAKGVRFHCPPQDFRGIVKATYGRDPDGNIFEIQEIVSPDHPWVLESVRSEAAGRKVPTAQ